MRGMGAHDRNRTGLVIWASDQIKEEFSGISMMTGLRYCAVSLREYDWIGGDRTALSASGPENPELVSGILGTEFPCVFLGKKAGSIQEF